LLLPAIALTTDTSIITAISNDYSYERIFSRQVEALGKPADVFFGISTSGKSKNIIEAVKQAKTTGIKTIGLAGSNKTELDDFCDVIIHIPSKETDLIQENHLMVEHIICEILENEL
jgi:D-sedoheptulose 7-phosphate isomerase